MHTFTSTTTRECQGEPKDRDGHLENVVHLHYALYVCYVRTYTLVYTYKHTHPYIY